MEGDWLRIVVSVRRTHDAPPVRSCRPELHRPIAVSVLGFLNSQEERGRPNQSPMRRAKRCSRRAPRAAHRDRQHDHADDGATT